MIFIALADAVYQDRLQKGYRTKDDILRKQIGRVRYPSRATTEALPNVRQALMARGRRASIPGASETSCRLTVDAWPATRERGRNKRPHPGTEMWRARRYPNAKRSGKNRGCVCHLAMVRMPPRIGKWPLNRAPRPKQASQCIVSNNAGSNESRLSICEGRYDRKRTFVAGEASSLTSILSEFSQTRRSGSA